MLKIWHIGPVQGMAFQDRRAGDPRSEPPGMGLRRVLESHTLHRAGLHWRQLCTAFLAGLAI